VGRPPWRVTSRPTVEAARSRRLAISRMDEPEAIPREMSSRSARVRASRERRRALGGIPPRGNNKQRMELCGLSRITLAAHLGLYVVPERHSSHLDREMKDCAAQAERRSLVSSARTPTPAPLWSCACAGVAGLRSQLRAAMATAFSWHRRAPRECRSSRRLSPRRRGGPKSSPRSQRT
jgi:hypothetical protein